MFSSERKIIGAVVSDVEQALTEQYGRASIQEKGRSQESVTYVVRVTSKGPALATILPNPNGVTLRIAPYMSPVVGVIYVVIILLGFTLLIVPGVLVAAFLAFQLWFTGKLISQHIDNVASGAEHQSKLRQSAGVSSAAASTQN